MRLAVKTGAWSPSPSEWKVALEVIERCEPIEFARIMRLKIEEDRKRSLTGRLLLRYACSDHTGLPYEKIRLERTDRNKPICPDLDKVQMNLSHHGDWVVLVSHMERSIGVDVMKFEEPRRGRDTFFNSMRRQFTDAEWTNIGTSLEKFYTYWALKESYIKGLGIGLGFNLLRANFLVNGNVADVEIDGALDPNWEFQLSSLDDMHVVAVAIGAPRTLGERSLAIPFQVLQPDELLAKFTS